MPALDQKFLDIVGGPIYSVWNEIGSDCAQCAQESGEELDNEGAIEGCIDADRLWYGKHGAQLVNGKLANEAISAAIKEHGYQAVLAYLARNINLV